MIRLGESDRFERNDYFAQTGMLKRTTELYVIIEIKIINNCMTIVIDTLVS